MLYRRWVYTSMNHGIYLQSATFQSRITSGISSPHVTESTLMVLGQTGQRLLGTGNSRVPNISKFLHVARIEMVKFRPSFFTSRAQVVGWPPIRSYRKNTMATNQLKSSKEDVDAKQGQGFLYAKVSMDGATYLRKVDLKTYKNYKDMSLALEKMFIGFSTGSSVSNVIPWKDGVSENRKDGEYVLTYEDKDRDWMLVGDVPWE